MITEDEFYAALLERARQVASFFGAHVYQVVSQTGEQVSLRPVTSADGLSDELVMDKAHGIPGVTTTLQKGALVLVTWRGGDPGQPMVVGYFGGETTIKPKRIRFDVAEDLGTDTGIQMGGAREVAMGDTWKTYLDNGLRPLVLALAGGNPATIAAAVSAEQVAYTEATDNGWSSTKLGTE